MSLDCKCNRLREAEWALRVACAKLADVSGTCPADQENCEPRNCEKECYSGIDFADCWARYFTYMARREA